MHHAVTFNDNCVEDEEDINDTVTFNDNSDEDEEAVRLTLSGHDNHPEEKVPRPCRQWQGMNMCTHCSLDHNEDVNHG